MTNEKIELPADTLKASLKAVTNVAMTYTLAHIAQRRDRRPRTVESQLLHVVSEIGEVYECIRQNRSEDEKLHEIVDVVLSALTLLNLAEWTNDPMLKNNLARNKIIDQVIDKVTMRLDRGEYADPSSWKWQGPGK